MCYLGKTKISDSMQYVISRAGRIKFRILSSAKFSIENKTFLAIIKEYVQANISDNYLAIGQLLYAITIPAFRYAISMPKSILLANIMPFSLWDAISIPRFILCKKYTNYIQYAKSIPDLLYMQEIYQLQSWYKKCKDAKCMPN